MSSVKQPTGQTQIVRVPLICGLALVVTAVLIIGFEVTYEWTSILCPRFGSVWWYDVTAIPFDKGRWVDADHNVETYEARVRLRMLKSLLSHHKLIGMSRDEVESLLGEGYEGTWSKGGPFGDNELSYGLGPASLLDTHHSWILSLKLQNNKVTDCTLWREE